MISRVLLPGLSHEWQDLDVAPSQALARLRLRGGDQGWAGMRRRLEHVLWDTTGPGSLPVTWGHSSTQKWNSVAKGEPENGGRAAKVVEVSHWSGEEAECIQSQSCWTKMLEKLGKEEERNKLNCLGLL